MLYRARAWDSRMSTGRSRRITAFLAVLLLGLGLLTAGGWLAISRITAGWFERDLELRAQLAISAASGALLRNWDDNRDRLAETLRDITRDERIMAGALCTPDGEQIVATEVYPTEFSCRSLLELSGPEAPPETAWRMTSTLPSGRVLVNAVPVARAGTLIGYALLVQDLSFVTRREATTRRILLAAFVVLSLGASGVTILAARLAWSGWTAELRRALSGSSTPGFEPLLRDVRSLVERLIEDQREEARIGAWNPERLRAALIEHLHGERIALLANREPYIHEQTPAGTRVVHPASGLVTALEPVMRACSGVWIAHGSGSGDRDAVDAHDRVRVPPGEESYLLRRVWLTPEEEAGYYYGFSNEGLWPLCHLAHVRPAFRERDWQHYVQINQRFADALVEEVDSDDPIVLVQDYHFALAPRMIRRKLPRATILTFWHIPWPSAERLGICPWRQELLAGLLGSSIIGFHTREHCNHLIESVDAFVECRIDRETTAVVQGTRRTLVRPYPISIEWPVRWMQTTPPISVCREEIRSELGLSPDALLGIGVDRLDYTKGIEERLQAVDHLLIRHPEFRGRFTFVQLAAPSRTKIANYQDLNVRVEALATEICARWATPAWRPIVLLRAHHEAPSIYRFYRASELCYVSSLHDGMNLVAKEFVAARDDEQGVLVLSQFTGAARDLTEALIVNPYDLAQAADALAAALRMRPREQQDRMRSMRRLVSEHNVYRWAGRMLVDAAELRRRDRLAGRLRSGEPGPALS
jgi:trehalose 6-phosphate synthase